MPEGYPSGAPPPPVEVSTRGNRYCSPGSSFWAQMISRESQARRRGWRTGLPSIWVNQSRYGHLLGHFLSSTLGVIDNAVWGWPAGA